MSYLVQVLWLISYIYSWWIFLIYPFFFLTNDVCLALNETIEIKNLFCKNSLCPEKQQYLPCFFSSFICHYVVFVSEWVGAEAPCAASVFLLLHSFFSFYR